MQALLAPHAGDLTVALDSVRTFIDTRRAGVTQALSEPAVFPPLSILDYCLHEIGTVSGAFAAAWGTYGSMPPAGTASIAGSVTGLPAFTAIGSADAGLPASDPNRYRALLSLYFDLANGRQARLDATFESTQFVPGPRLAIDGQQVDASLAFTEGLALLDQGTIGFMYASTAPGGRICGTFGAKAYAFTGGHLIGGPDSASLAMPVVTTATQPAGADVASVMRGRKPGRND